jgi:NhaP-type Na+/H+ or K+/H+ antiporter
MFELVEISTRDVFTVKLALVAPAGIVTLLGTLAAPLLLLDRTITAPPAGAGPLNFTVPVDDWSPPMTVDGLNVSEESVAAGGGAGVTVSVAVRLAPP